MTDIVEKVAQAILDHEWGQPVERVDDEDRRLAKVAIQATLEVIRDTHFAFARDVVDQLIKELSDD